MAFSKFRIPLNLHDLIQYVTKPYNVKELHSFLQDARRAYKAGGTDGGINFILDKENFNTYYSILYHIKTVSVDVTYQAYKDLQDVLENLSSALPAILEDKDALTDEVKAKYLNILQMLVYLFTELVTYFSDNETARNHLTVSKRSKENASNYSINKSKVLLVLANLINLEISCLWDPPIAEETFVSLISNVCFSLLSNSSIKNDKALQNDLFDVLGILLKNYNFSTTLCVRLVHSIKTFDHLGGVVPEGIKLIAERYNSPGLVKQLIKETIEWQNKGDYHDAKGEKNCNNFITEVAVLMPEIICKDIDYLTKYLSTDVVPLRNSVVTILAEVIAKRLTKPELTEDERQLRDELFQELLDHLDDVSGVVRTCVIQNVTKLQIQSAIPLNQQDDILKKVILHLQDKTSSARKAAVNCVKTFLSHNPYGAQLQLSKIEAKLKEKTEELENLEATYKDAQMDTLKKIDSEWSELEAPLKEVINNYKDDDDDEDEDMEEEIPPSELLDKIRSLLKEKKFTETVHLCKKSKKLPDVMNEIKESNKGNEVEIFLFFLRSIYIRLPEVMLELRTRAGVSAEDVEKIEALEKDISFYSKCASFLKILESAIQQMRDLLLSVTIGDMKEAIQFFIAAYEFQIDGAYQGILAMLRLMQVNEQERKDSVVEAFRTIYLTTSAKTVGDHTTEVTNRLIRLLQEISVDDFEFVEDIVSEWSAAKVLDNNIINRCWDYVLRKVDVSEAETRGACEILRMASLGRSNIIQRNIKTVSLVAFGDYGKENLLFLSSACRFLAVAGRGNSKNEKVQRFPHNDEMFTQLVDVLSEKIFEPAPYFPEVLESSIDMIYQLCNQPNAVCDSLFKKILPQIDPSECSAQVVINLCSLLGAVAIKLLNFLDYTVYLELKRRRELKNSKNDRQNRKSRSNNANSTMSLETTTLEGAESNDRDAGLIIQVLDEEIVCGSGLLAQFTEIVISICQNQTAYDNVIIQGNAVKTFLRFMLVSRTFCVKHVNLLFTILAKTKYPKVKCSILLHCSDLLSKFPNVVEPWTPRIYVTLQDESVLVRKTTLFTLANLILRDMVRAHEHITHLAFCLTDPCEEISNMCKDFFMEFTRKDNNLANIIPDIFSCLNKNQAITEDKFQFIMTFLFNSIDKTKRMENMVDRFCGKYPISEDINHQKRVTYCLSLVTYNDKALRKLMEKFPLYRDVLKVEEIYEVFEKILTECSKPVAVGKVDLKPIVQEIEALFKTVDGLESVRRPTPTKPKQNKKSERKKAPPKSRKQRKSRTVSSSSDSD